MLFSGSVSAEFRPGRYAAPIFRRPLLNLQKQITPERRIALPRTMTIGPTPRKRPGASLSRTHRPASSAPPSPVTPATGAW
jgi:hypothetical protein